MFLLFFLMIAPGLLTILWIVFAVPGVNQPASIDFDELTRSSNGCSGTHHQCRLHRQDQHRLHRPHLEVAWAAAQPETTLTLPGVPDRSERPWK